MNTMVKPGDVVVTDFAGATLVKVRPMVVISSASYHKERPDAIVALLTTNIASATTSSDYVLQDWQQAGLNKPSAFRTYLGMEGQADLRVIGHLSARDWQGVTAVVRGAIA
jgi:mRNA interferase MazF